MGRLQAQMNPHFLFNALNAVMAIRHDPRAVEEVTQSLAEYLRFSLEPSQQFEPLARELESLEKYFTVQQARFGSDLACAIKCDREASEVRVPPMILQPVLENAFNYGTRPEEGPLEVRVTARVLDKRLHLTISNTGNWVRPGSTTSPGTGIRNLRERFRILYEDTATIEVTENHGWVHVDIDLPTTPPLNVIFNPAA
jgi:two-component system sensor histidine kinase AlgZ